MGVICIYILWTPFLKQTMCYLTSIGHGSSLFISFISIFLSRILDWSQGGCDNHGSCVKQNLTVHGWHGPECVPFEGSGRGRESSFL